MGHPTEQILVMYLTKNLCWLLKVYSITKSSMIEPKLDMKEI